jgi:hypothetical protein
MASASAQDGAQFRNIVQRDNTASTVWADAAYRSKTNEQWLQTNGNASDLHQKKPKGKPMPLAKSRANAHRSKVRAAVEHVFARHKETLRQFVRTIGMANIACNMQRYVWLEGKSKSA